MRKSSFISKMSALTLSLLMASCAGGDIDGIISSVLSNQSSDSATSVPSDPSTQVPSSDPSMPSVPSSDSTPAASSSTKSEPSKSSSSTKTTGGSSSSSSSSASSSSSSSQQPSPYEVTEAYWTANITNLGFFKSGQNLTFNLAQGIGSDSMSGLLENDDGKIHAVMGSDEFYLAPLADGSLEYYEQQGGAWAKTTIPAAYAATYYAIFESYLKPWAFSDFTFTDPDYFKASDTIYFDNGAIPVKFIQFHFDNNQIRNFKYDYADASGNIVGHFEANASKHGTTTVTLPDASQPQTEIPVSSVLLNKSSLNLEVGQSEQLTATVLPDDATDKTVVWRSSNSGVASVVDGLVVAKSVGTAKIMAVAGTVTAVCTVQVSEAVQPVVNHFAGVTLSYAADSFVGAIMDESYNDAAVESFASKITISFFDDGVKDETESIMGGSFELYSTSALGEIEYAYFGKFYSYTLEGAYAEIELESYYSGTTGKYYHGDHMYQAKEYLFENFEFVEYDETSGLYNIEAYIAQPGSMAAGAGVAAKGEFCFQATGNAPVHLNSLPEDLHDDVYENLVQNAVYAFQSLTSDPADFADNNVYASVATGSTVSIFEENYMEVYRIHALSREGAVLDEVSVDRGSYTINESGEGLYTIEFTSTDIVMGYDVMPITEVLTFEYNSSANTLTMIEEMKGVSSGSAKATGYFVYAKQAEAVPERYQVPVLPNNWDAELIATRIGAMGSTASLPSLPGVLQCTVSGIVDGSFTITAVLASKTSGATAYTEFVQALVAAEYGYTMSLADGTLSYLSSEGKIIVTTDMNTGGSNYVVTITVSSSTPSYPTEGISAWLTAHNVTDAIPEFMNSNANKYQWSVQESGQAVLMISLKSGTDASALATTFTSVLSRMGYSTMTSGETTLYISPNGQVAFTVMSFSYSGSSTIYVMFMDASELGPGPSNVYPSEQIDALLTGVTDEYPSFANEAADSYAFQEESDGMGTLAILLAEGADADAIVTEMLGALVTMEYEEKVFKFDHCAYEGYVVSPNRQIAISVWPEEEGSSNVIYMSIINLTAFEDVEFEEDVSNLPTGIEASGYTKSYTVGDTFEFDGEVYAIYGAGGVMELSVDDLVISEPDMSKAGTKEITITYTIEGTVLTTTITIDVIEPEPEPEEVECVFRCGDDKAWVMSKDAIFRIWVWGGEYEGGCWITPDVNDEGAQVIFTAEIYNNAEGAIIVRFSPETEFPPVWDETLDDYVWNQTDNILSYAFAEDYPSFNFGGAPRMTNYTYMCTTNWDIQADSAVFKVWAWGGEYGAGMWLDVTVNGRFERETGRFTVSFSAYNNAAGFVFCRINPADAENLPDSPWPDSFKPWNQSGNLLELGEGVTAFSI